MKTLLIIMVLLFTGCTYKVQTTHGIQKYPKKFPKQKHVPYGVGEGGGSGYERTRKKQ